MSTIRVNMRTAVVNSQIRRERTPQGREVLIVPSATLPDNVVMNRVLYPAEEIAKSFHLLENSPAPLGHPQIDGQLINAADPRAINGYWIGAYNCNVRREGGRVLLDKVIDLDVANRTDGGRRVIDAVNAGAPIHTSTGLILDLEPAPPGCAEYDWIGRNMRFDHDAILLDEPGAATPEQGVGMLVNGERMQVMHANVADAVVTAEQSYNDKRDRINLAVRKLGEDHWMVDMTDSLVVYEDNVGVFWTRSYSDDGKVVTLGDEPEQVTRSINWVRRLPLVNRLLSLLGSGHTEPQPSNTDEVTTMDKTQLEAILAANAEAITAAVTAAVAPLQGSIAALSETMTANARAAEAEKRADVERVIGKAAADLLTGNALDEAHKSLIAGNAIGIATRGDAPNGREAYNTAPEE